MHPLAAVLASFDLKSFEKRNLILKKKIEQIRASNSTSQNHLSSIAYIEALPQKKSQHAIPTNLKPSSRMVLMKSFNEKGFIFNTNLNSKKSKEIIKKPRL